MCGVCVCGCVCVDIVGGPFYLPFFCFCFFVNAHSPFWPINDFKTHFKLPKSTLTNAVSNPFGSIFVDNDRSTSTTTLL